MRVQPEAQAKLLSQCKTGELVRNPRLNRLAIVAPSENACPLPALVYLTDDASKNSGKGSKPVPRIEQGFPYDLDLLSYGTDYVLRVDHDTHVGTIRDEIATINGVMLLEGSSYILRVMRPEDSETGGGNVYFDMTKGVLVEGRSLSNAFVFGKWDIVLRDGCSLVSFVPPRTITIMVLP